MDYTIKKRWIESNFKKLILHGFMLVMALTSCNDDPEEVFVGDMEQYQKAYITTGVSYPNASVFKNISMGSTNLTVQDDGKLVLDEKKGLTLPNELNLETDLFFRTVFPVKTGVSGTLALRSDAEEYVGQYNSEQGLDEESGYKLFPSEWYTLEGSHATIATGQKEAIIRFVPNEDAAWNSGLYMLPLSLTLDPGSQVTLSENMSSLCLAFQINPPSTEYPEGSRLLTPEEYSVNTISETLQGDDMYGLAFDQDPDTEWDLYFSYLYGESTVEIEFNEPHYLSHIPVMGGDYGFYVYVKAEGEDSFKSKWFSSEALKTVNTKEDLGLDPDKKVKTVRIKNYYTYITDVYFLVHD